MEPKDSIEKLEKSKEYKDWKKENPDGYLANCFAMIEKENPREWHIGYYSLKKDRIVSFIVSDKITKTPESEVFKEKKKVMPLIKSDIKVEYSKAIENAVNLQKIKYPGNAPLKTIILLQNYDGHHIYNITFVTQAFKTLNVKISCRDGRVVSDQINSIFDFNDKRYDKK